MDQTAQVVIVKVQSKTLNGRNGAFTKYEIEANDGRTYQTTKREIAEQAHAKTGQQVTISYYNKPNNGYDNWILNGVSVPGEALGGGGIPAADAGQGGSTIQAAAQESPQETRESIHRQVAAKVAAQLSQTPSEFWGNVRDLKLFFDTGTIPGAQVAETQQQQSVAADDDIPF